MSHPTPTATRCPDTGIWIYDQLPGNMRVATDKDFFHGLHPRYGFKYLALSEIDGTYQAYTFTQNKNPDEIRQLLKQNRLFVPKTHPE